MSKSPIHLMRIIIRIIGYVKEPQYEGNPESLCSSSHGMGRMGSRRWARETIQLDKFTSQMEDVVAKVSRQTLDEAPDAYKPIDLVLKHQKDLVDIIHHVKPIINIKG